LPFPFKERILAMRRFVEFTCRSCTEPNCNDSNPQI
jgi:hypothetical protein